MSLLEARLGQRVVAAGAEPPAGTIALVDLPRNHPSCIVGIDESAPPEIARRLFDLGIAPGADIAVLRRAPLKDPVIYTVAGYDIALRREQARLVRVSAA